MAMSNLSLRPAWVEVDLSAIEDNTRRLVDIAAGAELMAMVKANAYGHGAVEVAKAAVRGGATWLGVYSVGEGVELREHGIETNVLVVGATLPERAGAGVANRLTLTVFSMDTAQAAAVAARELGTEARVHVKLNTGMNRLGIAPEDTVQFVRAVNGLGNTRAEGIFTHFAMADTPDAHDVHNWGVNYTREQLSRFNGAIGALEEAGISLRYLHCANSPATTNLPEARFNLVRSGILIYGLDPSPEVPRPAGFRPALAFKTQIAQVREVPAGVYVSYGATFRTERPTRLAVMMVGYADGFRRGPRNYREVLIRGRRVPIAGRVCMDQTVADVTELADVGVGDEVVLIGRQRDAEITAEEVGERLGTNNYETVTTISSRVERRYR